ncbi:MAG: hypothetical protein PHH27_02265 [Candidatus Colwellbacteria bacterium]|nr:hypothetical protein [Candidatus Colwellbacteria bacterium]MDD4818980.1 hypothetical protein [Candidatus Colwellbacteria bacterium]
MFNQIKAAKEAMKNMSPDEMKQMMEQAKETQKMLDDMIEKKVEKMIKEKDLVSRQEVEKIIRNN